MDFLRRQKKLRDDIASKHLDGLLVSHLPNIRYLCGFTGSAGLLLVEQSGCCFFTDSRYDTHAHEQVEGARVVVSRQNIVAEMTERIGRRKGGGRSSTKKTIGIEADYITVAEKKRLAALLRSSHTLKDAPGLVEQARMVKDGDELECIRAAVQLGAGLFERAVQVIRPGIKEVEVAAEMEYAARRAGAEEMSFPTIIASGVRSALPHGRASSATIERGGFVVCDWGVILSGYCSDQTRTVWVGAVQDDARAAYEAVLEAQEAAVDAVRPGATVGEVDSAARKVLRKAGLGRYFTHSTGHGVGIEIHESPRVAAGLEQQLTPGMVITIEPGVYIPGRWGVRIEDMVAVADRGREVLTPTGKALMVL
jgi:Xaa-Pro aminopeptidase